jgi:uncharacterized protein YegL
MVLDTSKSMKGHKWEVTIRAVIQAIDMLCEEDQFAIVTYSSEVRAKSLVDKLANLSPLLLHMHSCSVYLKRRPAS